MGAFLGGFLGRAWGDTITNRHWLCLRQFAGCPVLSISSVPTYSLFHSVVTVAYTPSLWHETAGTDISHKCLRWLLPERVNHRFMSLRMKQNPNSSAEPTSSTQTVLFCFPRRHPQESRVEAPRGGGRGRQRGLSRGVHPFCKQACTIPVCTPCRLWSSRPGAWLGEEEGSRWDRYVGMRQWDTCSDGEQNAQGAQWRALQEGSLVGSRK